MKAFYHSADLDGHCSGAIIKDSFPRCEMIGINYGQEFPWERIEPGEVIFLLDFTLQPFDLMEKLDNLANLIWIDHHKTGVEEAQRRGFEPKGIRRVGIGACALAWEFYRRKKMPLAVRLLSEYDVWIHSNPLTLPFQYGFRMYKNTRPDNQQLWKLFFRDNSQIDAVAHTGRTILAYEESQNEKFCRDYAFETELNGLKAICVNRGFTNSKVFESVFNPEKHDLMITFCRLKYPAQKWTVSLYSTKVDCGAIARKYGGGGHVGAAGFQCEELPFLH